MDEFIINAILVNIQLFSTSKTIHTLFSNIIFESRGGNDQKFAYILYLCIIYLVWLYLHPVTSSIILLDTIRGCPIQLHHVLMFAL